MVVASSIWPRPAEPGFSIRANCLSLTLGVSAELLSGW